MFLLRLAQVHADTFSGAGRKFRRIPWAKLSKERHNRPRDGPQTEKRVGKLLSKVGFVCCVFCVASPPACLVMSPCAPCPFAPSLPTILASLPVCVTFLALALCATVRVHPVWRCCAACVRRFLQGTHCS